eukprot:gene17627-11157_t
MPSCVGRARLPARNVTGDPWVDRDGADRAFVLGAGRWGSAAEPCTPGADGVSPVRDLAYAALRDWDDARVYSVLCGVGGSPSTGIAAFAPGGRWWRDLRQRVLGACRAVGDVHAVLICWIGGENEARVGKVGTIDDMLGDMWGTLKALLES